jgi:predicted RNA methylase
MTKSLETGVPNVRKALAFLLSHFNKSPQVVKSLCHVLIHDEEPKVRKNAAVSLGKIGDSYAVDALIMALNQEKIPWVRPSIILSLGAIGGEVARIELQKFRVEEGPDKEALRKALDRVEIFRENVAWVRSDWRYPLVLEAPVGLESIAIDEAHDCLRASLSHFRPGLLLVPDNVRPWDLIPKLRCIYGMRIVAGQAAPLDLNDYTSCVQTISDLIRNSAPLKELTGWLVSDGSIKFRFSFEKSTRKELFLRMLEAVRKEAERFGLIDSPSNYNIEFVIDTDEHGTVFFIKPSFHKDDRFSYRIKDVPASINPTVAACLARLVRVKSQGVVFDPTCGSGTLLIERALLDDGVELRGIDINKAAITAARENIRAAGLTKRVRVMQGNASDSTKWHECSEILANLPFGIRIRGEAKNFELLYNDILNHTASKLESSGRALVYTSQKKIIENSLQSHRHDLRLKKNYKVLSGGLWVNLWLLSRVSKTHGKGN